MDREKQEVTLKVPASLDAAAAANLTLMASSDGRLFGRKLLQIRVYPDCIPDVQDGCGVDGVIGRQVLRSPSRDSSGGLSPRLGLALLVAIPIFALFTFVRRHATMKKQNAHRHRRLLDGDHDGSESETVELMASSEAT